MAQSISVLARYSRYRHSRGVSAIAARRRLLGLREDAAKDQSSLRWFKAAFAGWLDRSADERRDLGFEIAAEVWPEVQLGPFDDLREERRAFMAALSAAGECEITTATFYEIAHVAELLRVDPVQIEVPETRKLIRDKAKETRKLRRAVHALRKALEFIDRGHPRWVANADLERIGIMGRLQSVLRHSVLGRALGAQSPEEAPSELVARALADLDQGLEECLREWKKPRGRPPNAAVHAFLASIIDLYGAMGGRREASWDTAKGHPRTPLAKLLTLLFLALSSDLQVIAASSASGFVDKADRVISKLEEDERTERHLLADAKRIDRDREGGVISQAEAERQTRRVMRGLDSVRRDERSIAPMTDAEWQAALDHAAGLQAEGYELPAATKRLLPPDRDE